MANAIYPKFKQELMKGTTGTNLDSGTVKVALIDTSLYTYNASHELYDAGGASDVIDAVVGTPQTLGTKTFVSGTFDADDVTFTAVSQDLPNSKDSVNALVIYTDTGSSASSRLVAYLDTNITGLPVTPNGGNITVTWNASGIFTL